MTKRSKRAPCVVSVAEHTGWAHLLCVAAREDAPAVVARRRVTLIDPGLPTQPYEHDSRALPERDANALIARVQRSVAACSSLALQGLVAELAPDHAIVALAIRKPPFAELPRAITDVWNAYRLLCAADGMLYQLAICRAARRLQLDVQLCVRGEETTRAAERLGVTPEIVEEFVARTGRPPGPPWTEEHRRAFAAGIAALAAHTRERLRMTGPPRRLSA
jgi:hypothetical protein